ncbi:MAG: transposase, partial [Actinomycetia bacterium]|nr:transposase [Actinomycetes bacterium]
PGIPVAEIAEVTFTSADRVREVIHNFNADGFDSLHPKYSGGRPKRCRRVPGERPPAAGGIVAGGFRSAGRRASRSGVG